MNLQKLLYTNLGSFFQINGGLGTSFEQAIRFDFDNKYDYLKSEQDIIYAMGLLQNCYSNIVNRSLMRNNNRMYDVITVRFSANGDLKTNEVFVEKVYFDVSEYWR